MPELSPLLKRLRLSGILDSFETRNREAIDKRLSYVDFLAHAPLSIHCKLAEKAGRPAQPAGTFMIRWTIFENSSEYNYLSHRC